jgi:hypothetical protein
VWFLMTHQSKPDYEGSEILENMHELYATKAIQPIPPGVSVHHSDLGDTGKRAPGVIDNDPFNPTGLGAAPLRTHRTLSDIWTRYVIEWRFNVPGAQFTEWTELTGAAMTGTYDMFSLWMIDATQLVPPVLYRVPVVRTYPYLNTFRWAWDCSTNNLDGGGLTGPIVGYGRNIVVLRNDIPVEENDAPLLEPPMAG